MAVECFGLHGPAAVVACLCVCKVRASVPPCMSPALNPALVHSRDNISDPLGLAFTSKRKRVSYAPKQRRAGTVCLGESRACASADVTPLAQILVFGIVHCNAPIHHYTAHPGTTDVWAAQVRATTCVARSVNDERVSRGGDADEGSRHGTRTRDSMPPSRVMWLLQRRQFSCLITYTQPDVRHPSPLLPSVVQARARADANVLHAFTLCVCHPFTLLPLHRVHTRIYPSGA